MRMRLFSSSVSTPLLRRPGSSSVSMPSLQKITHNCLGLAVWASRGAVQASRKGPNTFSLALRFPKGCQPSISCTAAGLSQAAAAPRCVLRATPATLSLGWLVSESASSSELTSSFSLSPAKSSDSQNGQRSRVGPFPHGFGQTTPQTTIPVIGGR